MKERTLTPAASPLQSGAFALTATRVSAATDPFEQQYKAELDANRDGVVSADELQRFGQARARVAWIPLSSMLLTEQRLASESPQFATTQQRLARALVKAGGSANQEDVEAVVANLLHLPASVLVGIQRAGITIVVCRGGVTDYLKWLKNQPVRGHTKADSWQTVPGTSVGNEVVIATIDSPYIPGRRMVPATGSHHGSHSVLLHELGHAIAPRLGQFQGLSNSRDWSEAHSTTAFLAARTQDWDRLLPYYQQDGKGRGAGADEAFAESFARFYGGDPTLQNDWPALYRYWNESTRPASQR